VSKRTEFNDDLKTAMKGGDQMAVATLRLINAALKQKDIDARPSGKEVTEADILSMLQGMIKQRQESLKIFRDNKRDDLADKEAAEIAVIEKYLPKQMSDAEVAAVVDKLIKETGAASQKDMGKVMGALKSQYAGQLDMGKAGAVVKQKLG
jgi:uncharacterized protein YqeY